MKKKALFAGLLSFSFLLCACGNGGKTVIYTPNAPEAIGPYNQAIVYDGVVYCSGQIGLDPTTGKLVGKDVASQTRQIFKNITAVLEAANSSLDFALRATVYLTDINNFDEVNGIYTTYFNKETSPARSCVEVSELPKGALIEIEMTATVK